MEIDIRYYPKLHSIIRKTKNGDANFFKSNYVKAVYINKMDEIKEQGNLESLEIALINMLTGEDLGYLQKEKEKPKPIKFIN